MQRLRSAAGIGKAAWIDRSMGTPVPQAHSLAAGLQLAQASSARLTVFVEQAESGGGLARCRP